MKNYSKIKINVLNQLVQYHEETEQFILVIAKLVGWIRTGKAADAYSEFRAFCKRDVAEHFEFEEKVVFPVVFEDASQRKTWIDLNKVHSNIGIKQKTIESLFDELLRNNTKETAQKLEVAITTFLSACKSHAEFENKIVIPLIEQNPGLNFALGRTALQHSIDTRNKIVDEAMSPKPVDPGVKKTGATENIIYLGKG